MHFKTTFYNPCRKIQASIFLDGHNIQIKKPEGVPEAKVRVNGSIPADLLIPCGEEVILDAQIDENGGWRISTIDSTGLVTFDEIRADSVCHAQA